MSPVRACSLVPCLCVLALCAAPAPPGAAQEGPWVLPGVPPGGPLTIEDAVAIGREYHPSLAIAKYGQTSARGAYVQARSSWLPSLDVRSDYSRSMSSGRAIIGGVPVEGAGDRYATQYSTSLSASQLLYDFGRTSDELRRARHERRLAKFDVDQVEDDVTNTVQQMFLMLCANEELLEVARYRVRLQEDTLAMVLAQYEADLVPRADVAKAQSALAAAALDVTSGENAVATSRINLNEAMGVDVRTRYGVGAPEPPEPTALTVDELIEIALVHRPDVLAARAARAAAEAGLSGARKGHRPSVNASAGYGWREEEFPPTRDHWSVGVALGFSVFDGKLAEGRVMQARAQRDSAREGEYQTRQVVALETAQALLDMQTALEQIGSAQATVTSAQEDLELANGRYEANIGILLEILDAQSLLTAAQADLAVARFNYLAAVYALERAIGVSLSEAAALAIPEAAATP